MAGKRDEQGRFKKGNPGRPKGAANKSTEALRERVEQLLSDQFDQVLEDMATLSPKERISAYIQLLEYALPKLARTESTVTNIPVNPYADWTDEQIADELERLEGFGVTDTGRYEAAFEREPHKT